MKTYPNSLFFVTAQIILLMTPPAVSAQQADSQSQRSTNIAVQARSAQKIPAGAFGIVEIDAPRVATLLQLRGIMGQGIAIMKSDDNDDCLSLPVRLVAGDFGGDSVSTHQMKPIRIIIQTASVYQALVRGQDVVSDMYRTSSQLGDLDADIIIESGLSDSHGFVINPGSSVVADIFGTTPSRISCRGR